VDEETIAYLKGTGRSAELCDTVRAYFEAQQMWGIARHKGELDFTAELELDLASVVPCVSGPKRPQDRIEVPALQNKFRELLAADVKAGGFGKAQASAPTEVVVNSKADARDQITDGSVLIAAITSCTNTSNPSVMLAAGLLAKKANERGLKVRPSVKTSLGPGSRVVTDYLQATGLGAELDKLGFQTVGYGCTTCIGNSGPLDAGIEEGIRAGEIVAASVLSGNRNFEARVHQSIKANFLMSPPLVVAYAIAGTVDIDLSRDELVPGSGVHLRDIWPTLQEVQQTLEAALKPEVFRRLYTDFASQNPRWNEIKGSVGEVFEWSPKSTYIQHPPFFSDFTMQPGDIAEIHGARPLGIFGDSVTTDHISPAGNIKKDSPAGRFLTEQGVAAADFNSYGSRRGNDLIMTRGTFANVRIKNLMLGGKEGGNTLLQPEAKEMSIFDAAQAYRAQGTPTIVIGGEDYGMGSSRDWAAKGTRLLGVRAVITKSFERIHRSNLVGMGVLPCNFKNKADYDRVKDLANATFDLLGIDNHIKPMSEATLRVHPAQGEAFDVPVIVRLDTPVEMDYYRSGGILPFVLAQILRANPA
jgi:aconitate hydratase